MDSVDAVEGDKVLVLLVLELLKDVAIRLSVVAERTSFSSPSWSSGIPTPLIPPLDRGAPVEELFRGRGHEAVLELVRELEEEEVDLRTLDGCGKVCEPLLHRLASMTPHSSSSS
jgi:hypothetical protein